MSEQARSDRARSDRARNDRDGAGALPREGSRDGILLAVNGELRRVSGRSAFATLSDYLREELRLTGTKIVCSEGDCGACCVLVGRREPGSGDQGRLRYRSVDACIAFVYQLDCCHVVTVDALARRPSAQQASDLHPVQRAMAQSYGSQCGFCTPGFVIAITDLMEQARERRHRPSREEAKGALTGNLCRCTGYLQILEAVAAVDPDEVPAVGELFDEGPLIEAFEASGEDGIQVETGEHVAVIPRTVGDALSARADRPEASVVAGATDLGVRHNKGQWPAGDRLVLQPSLEGFSGVEVSDDGRRTRIGALTCWSEVLNRLEDAVPELADVLRRFGGPQIRNMGTVGGNLVNASPIADSLPFFYVADAVLDLISHRGERTCAVEDFYRGYKDLDLADDELLRSLSLRLPDPARGERVLLRKLSRRRDLDISTFTAALWLRVEEGRVAEARVAYGGVGPTVLRLPRTEESLLGTTLARNTFERAGELARGEISSISDVRGAARYRDLLAANVMPHFFHQLQGEAPTEAIP